MINKNYFKKKSKDGNRLYVFKDDHIADDIVNNRYELGLTLFITKLLSHTKSNSICIDVGANIGYYSIAMAKYAKLVIAYEPIPEVFYLLEENVKENQIKNVSCNNLGLSNVKKKEMIYADLGGNRGSSSIHYQRGNKKSSSVNVFLDIADHHLKKYNLQNIELIKIDVEGHEPEVILGMKDIVQQYRPVIIMEWDKKRVTEKFSEYKLFEKILSNYHVNVLLSNRDLIYRKIRKIPVLCYFRKCFKFFWKHLNYPKPKSIISNFNGFSAYQQNIVLIPNEKYKAVKNIMKW